MVKRGDAHVNQTRVVPRQQLRLKILHKNNTPSGKKGGGQYNSKCSRANKKKTTKNNKSNCNTTYGPKRNRTNKKA